MSSNADAGLGIGEVSRRLGLTPEVIRAWERRYEVVSPRRTNGGTRRYSSRDLERLRAMQREMQAGLPASQAAQIALAGAGSEEQPEPRDVAHLRDELVAATKALDETRAQTAIDSLLAAFTPEYVMREVFLPVYFDSVLGRVPGRELRSSEERFLVSLLRGRLLGLARGWGDGVGPVAVLACCPEEHRELALICFGIALRSHGWRILFLGADASIGGTRDVVRWLAPDFVLVASCDRRHFDAVRDELADLAAECPLAVVGRGLEARDAAEIGAHLVRHEPVAAATRLAEGHAP